ncbi:MAG: ABC transporter permease subunit, partial [Pseudomonadota bacterium]
MFNLRRAAAAAAIATTGLLLWTTVSPTQEPVSDTLRQLALFGDVFERVREDYVEEVSDQQLIEAAIQGMLSSLDPHSSYMNPKAYNDMRTTTRGKFGGLGIEVTMEGGYVKVVSPIDDTPAFRAGIQAIEHGQMEAARSLGMSYFQAMRYVILPQAIRVILPPLGNDFIAMLKDSSLISVLAVR